MTGASSMSIAGPWRSGITVIASALIAGALLFVASHFSLGMPGITVISTSIAVFSALALARYRMTIELVEHGLRQAQEGLLEPVDSRRVGGPFLRRFTKEYNTMVLTLRRMFSTVEECQARVLNERNKIDAILQSLPGALLHLSDDLQVVSTNKPAELMFGMPQERLHGINLFDLLAVDEHARDLLRDAFLYKRPAHNQEIRVSLEGRECWLSMNLAFINQNETDMGAVITLQDITDYRQLQDSVAIREKLVAIGQLAAGVAHELNTPLGNILGYSQLLRDTAGHDEKLARYASVVSDETKRCSRIVQDLLNYARQDRCSGETCDLGPLLADLVDTFMNCRLKRYNIALDLDLPETPLLVDGGCGQLDIVLTNLILNAIQAVTSVARPLIRIVGREDESGFVAIEVEDNGPGIPPEVRSRIFDPFFTTKDVGDGSGLGLSISQAMMVRRGGSIRHDPEYTGGARFILRLPAVQPEHAKETTYE